MLHPYHPEPLVECITDQTILKSEINAEVPDVDVDPFQRWIESV